MRVNAWSVASALACTMLLPCAAVARTTVIHVDAHAVPCGTGTGEAPLCDLADAVAQGRLMPDRVKIQLAPGTYVVEPPLLLDYPLDVIGSNQYVPSSDPEDTLPTGNLVAGTEATIQPAPGVAWFFTRPMVQIGTEGGPVLGGVSLQNLTLDLGLAPTGNAVNLRWAQGYAVKNCIVRAQSNASRAGTIGIQSIASSGTLEGNFFTQTGLATVIGGGNLASPSTVRFVGNRAVNNWEGGLFVLGGALIAGSERAAVDVIGNELIGSKGVARFSWGLRIAVVAPPIPNTGFVTANVRDNTIADNAVGIAVEAGFPRRYDAVTGACEPRRYSGSLDVVLRGNTLTTDPDASPHPFEQIASIVSFTRFTASLNKVGDQPIWTFLRNSSITIDDPDGTLAGAFVDHPATDPIVGVCPNDDGQPLDNHLLVNGVEQAHQFDAPQVCASSCAENLALISQGYLGVPICNGSPGVPYFDALAACVCAPAPFGACQPQCGANVCSGGAPNLDCAICLNVSCAGQLAQCQAH